MFLSRGYIHYIHFTELNQHNPVVSRDMGGIADAAHPSRDIYGTID